MEPIVITDEKIRAKVERIVNDLHEFYPDGKVYSLEALHKGLSNRIGETWKLAGYESRSQMLEAYGFDINSTSAGGRPESATVEAAEELFAELLMRYEGKEKPKALGALVHDNPDLKSQLKTYANKSQELFGMTWASVLKDRGILKSKGTKIDEALARQDDIEAMLDDLTECYEDVIEKPATLKALKIAHPEYEEEIELFSLASGQLYGQGAARYLKSIGILKASAVASVSSDDVEALLADLESRFGRYANDDKPANFTALFESARDIENEIKAARKSWEATNDSKFAEELKRRGIMKTRLTDQRRVLVRNANVHDLKKIWKEASGPNRIQADGEYGGLLPSTIALVDIEEHLQLEEFIMCFVTPDIPEELIADIENERFFFEADCYKLHITTALGKKLLTKDVSLSEEFEALRAAAETYSADHSIRKQVGAKILTISKNSSGLIDGSNPALIQMKLYRAMPLEAQTLLHVLCKAGLITEADLRAGEDWKTRNYSDVVITHPADSESRPDSASGDVTTKENSPEEEARNKMPEEVKPPDIQNHAEKPETAEELDTDSTNNAVLTDKKNRISFGIAEKTESDSVEPSTTGFTFNISTK